MSKIVTLENKNITLKISTFGAEIQSLVYKGKERIWQGGKDEWQGHAPILFPICGRLHDAKLIFDGKEYETPKHGFAKVSEFEIINEEKTTATFLLESNDETRKVYPFEFNFKVMFQLADDGVRVYHIVENKGKGDMYFNVGCHEAYAIDGDLSEYTLEFSDDVEPQATKLKDFLLLHEKFDLPYEDGELKLSFEQYVNNSYVLEDIKSDRVYLNRKGETVVTVYMKDFNNLVLWTTAGKKYFCIEPWDGLPDYYDGDYKLETKKAINKLKPNESKTFYHSFTFEE